MNHLHTMFRKQFVQTLVQRQIFCPVTQQVLDVQTCVVLVDRDGDPSAVLSQDGWQRQSDDQLQALEDMGVTVDGSTVGDHAHRFGDPEPDGELDGEPAFSRVCKLCGGRSVRFTNGGEGEGGA